MTTTSAKTMVLACALGANLLAFPALQAQPSSGQTATQTPPPPPPKPKTKPQEPIDPNETAGVRGPGSPVTVRVMLKSKTVEGAHVVVKNANGSLAGSCTTGASGDCKVEVGPDDYVIHATITGREGSVTTHVTDSTGPIVIKLTKTKPPAAAPAS
jgi:hypothetical protein